MRSSERVKSSSPSTSSNGELRNCFGGREEFEGVCVTSGVTKSVVVILGRRPG